ncbi:MAG: serine hydrolase domain-containing protein [Hyphomonadaceae bacterium]
MARVFASIVFGCLFLSSCATAPRAPSQNTPLASAIDAYLRPWADARQFSGVVIVARGEELLFERAYGMADFSTGRAHSIDSSFIIASLSKSFTAAVIERLAADGRLSFTDPISRFYPDFPRGGEITVEMLLLHRSGVAGEDDLPDYEALRLQPVTLQQQVARIAARPLQFEPGSRGSYSNSGYVLLAALAERASGRDFRTLLQEAVLARIGASDSGVGDPQGRWPDSFGYDPGPAPDLVVEASRAVHPSHFVGAGSMVSDADDVLAFLRASDTGGALDVTGLRYPYGWGVREHHGRREIEQTGIDDGFISAMAFYPDEDLYIVYLSNIHSGAFFQRAHIDIAGIVFGQAAAPFRPVAFDAAPRDVSHLVGRYDFPDAGPLAISANASGLWMSWFGQTTYLDPIPGGAYYNRRDAVEMRFESANGRPAAALIWGVGDDAVRAPRMPD